MGHGNTSLFVVRDFSYIFPWSLPGQSCTSFGWSSQVCVPQDRARRSQPLPWIPAVGVAARVPGRISKEWAIRPISQWTGMLRVCGVLTLSRAFKRPWLSTHPAVDEKSSYPMRGRCTVSKKKTYSRNIKEFFSGFVSSTHKFDQVLEIGYLFQCSKRSQVIVIHFVWHNIHIVSQNMLNSTHTQIFLPLSCKQLRVSRNTNNLTQFKSRPFSQHHRYVVLTCYAVFRLLLQGCFDCV